MKNNFITIDDAICEFIDRKNRQTTQHRGYKYWSASSLGKCKRYQVLNRAGIVTYGATIYKWQNAAMDGTASHEWRQAALKSIGVLVDMEQSVIDEDLHYRGHYDLVAELDGKLVLVDIKTQNNRAFRARGRLPDKIDECHKRQLGSYFYFLKRDVFPDLHSARMYYINKNTGEREELEIAFDGTYFKDIINELKTLNNHWKKRTLPKKELSYFCNICQHQSLCTELRSRKDTTIEDAIRRSRQEKTE